MESRLFRASVSLYDNLGPSGASCASVSHSLPVLFRARVPKTLKQTHFFHFFKIILSFISPVSECTFVRVRIKKSFPVLVVVVVVVLSTSVRPSIIGQ